jgi:hypothetical protein
MVLGIPPAGVLCNMVVIFNRKVKSVLVWKKDEGRGVVL